MAEATFTGNLGADAKLEYTQNGNPRLTFRAADTKSKPDGNGGWEKVAEQWLNVTIWGPLAEHLGNSGTLTKGARVQVIGEFYARDYEHNGERRTSLDVTAWGLRVIPSRNSQQRTQPPRQQPADDPWGTRDQEVPF